MKKTQFYEYDFNVKQEFSIYNNIGENNAKCQNYSEWFTYVQNKYSKQKYTHTSLTNFLHYLIRLRNSVEIQIDSRNNSLIPLISVALSMIMTFIFALMSIIDNFNVNITTIYAGNLQEQFYNANSFADSLTETLYSDMKLYLFGICVLILLGFLFFSYMTSKIKYNKQKYYFYCDYIEIITNILNQ